MDIAEQKLIYLSQIETFPSELKLLRSGEVITRNSRIAKYSPFIGPAGILRSTGRISRLVNSDFDSKHPIILDARHAVVRLLGKHLQVRNFHQILDYMRAVVNLIYVVLNLLWLLRNIENTCVACRKRKAQTVTHNIADLPLKGWVTSNLLSCNPAILVTQFLVLIPRKTEKRWGFLFTCLTTRAVHIEVVPSLDTSSWLMGVERFIARRGTPTTIMFDNGTNFVGAQKELYACVESWNKLAPAVFFRKGSSGNSIHPAHRAMMAPGSD